MCGGPAAKAVLVPPLQTPLSSSHLGGGDTLINRVGLPQCWLPPQLLSRGSQPEESYLFTQIHTGLLGWGREVAAIPQRSQC